MQWGRWRRFTRSQWIEDGRYVLMAIGVQRFRILSKHHLKPYLSGVVELYEDAVESKHILDVEGRKAYNLFGAYTGNAAASGKRARSR